MFEQALQIIAQLSASDRNPRIARLDKVQAVNHNFGYGVGDDMDSLVAKYVRLDFDRPSGMNRPILRRLAETYHRCVAGSWRGRHFQLVLAAKRRISRAQTRRCNSN
jgi:hypothetical protein